MLSLLLFLSLSFADTQSIEVSVSDSKKLIFEFEIYDKGYLHLKSFTPQPEGAKINHLDIQSLKLNNSQDSELKKIALNFVHKHIPLNEALNSYKAPKPLKFTEICEKIGKDHAGEFTNDQQELFQMTTRVGEKSSRCFGRCGFGCGVPFDNKNRYTQECLNHDLCNRELGENMGPCKDEYWAAADGYLNAKICEQKPI